MIVLAVVLASTGILEVGANAWHFTNGEWLFAYGANVALVVALFVSRPGKRLLAWVSECLR